MGRMTSCYREGESKDRIISGSTKKKSPELFYTSGSTGKPKGVMLSHRTLYLHALGLTGTVPQSDLGVELHTIPLFHANGWGHPQTCVMHGNKQVMVRRFEPSLVLRLIEEERVTGMSLVPVMANALLNCPELGKYDTSSLAEIFLGGAAASPDLVRRLGQVFRCPAIVGYGLTETAPVAAFAPDEGNGHLHHRGRAHTPIRNDGLAGSWQ